jgi:hypothetical protein
MACNQLYVIFSDTQGIASTQVYDMVSQDGWYAFQQLSGTNLLLGLTLSMPDTATSYVLTSYAQAGTWSDCNPANSNNQGNQGYNGIPDKWFIWVSNSQTSQGFQGMQGPAGSGGGTSGGGNGSQGFQGLRGTQGFQGLRGTQGFQGSQGQNGLTGFQGFQGLQADSSVVIGLSDSITGLSNSVTNLSNYVVGLSSSTNSTLAVKADLITGIVPYSQLPLEISSFVNNLVGFTDRQEFFGFTGSTLNITDSSLPDLSYNILVKL